MVLLPVSARRWNRPGEVVIFPSALHKVELKAGYHYAAIGHAPINQR
jgi:hypothetical protein